MISKEPVKLDEVLKYLFSTSKKVLIGLLNSIFDEDFKENEVEISCSNNEFIKDDLNVIRGDMFFNIAREKRDKNYYHIEFQTKNDNTMVIRTFEYGFKKADETANDTDDIKTLYFPKQKVIFFEENRNIKDELQLKIIFPDNKEIIYSVGVIKYWQLTEEELINRKMYPLLPLKLFNLRKDLSKAHKKKDTKRLKELSKDARNLSRKLAEESKDLFDENKILGEDFHKMLVSIQNLIEHLNVNYLNDDEIENEVVEMTKTLYDPKVHEEV